MVREKGREIILTLDGKEIKQENLINFYKDKDIFLVSHNPYYFWTLEPKKQKDLVRSILPNIDKEDAYNLLQDEDKKILEQPIENISSFILKKNESIYELEKEQEQNIGKIEAIKNILIQDSGDILIFDKEDKLQKLEQRYEDILSNFDNANLVDLKSKIEMINKKLEKILTDDLSAISEQYSRESKKLETIDSNKPICHTCRQEIKDSSVKEHLKKTYINEMNRLQQKANSLKEDAKRLNSEKKEKQEIYNKLNTSDMKTLKQEMDLIKNNIDNFLKEKNEITLHNQEVKIKQKNIKDAKDTLNSYIKVQEEIKKELEKNRKQKDIANKLKILVIEAQKERISKYLNNVDIEFSKVSKTTGEITECFEIKYEGRDYKNLSKSQQARACLEISNVFNNISKINVPIFFDDAESTTDILDIPQTQLIISLVIKYNPLEILDNYEDVLDRKEKSIKKEIEENSCYEIPFAA
ncbi:MAG: hypothetical protein J6M60_00365 [Clostridia bacterium]|nr:hypothetical protein [Clostridia bacterium]